MATSAFGHRSGVSTTVAVKYDILLASPSRTRERPQQRWDDVLRNFCEHTYGALFGFHSACEHVTLFPLETHFAQVCREQFSL